MKKILPLIFVLLVAACSDSDEPAISDGFDPNHPGEPKIDLVLVLNELHGIDVCYALDTVVRYNKSFLTGNLWEMDEIKWDGDGTYDSRLVFRNNRLYVPMPNVKGAMPSYPVHDILYLYREKTGFCPIIYTAVPCELDPDANTIRIDSLTTHDIREFTDDKLVFSLSSSVTRDSYYDEETQELVHLDSSYIEDRMKVITYTQCQPIEFDNETTLAFDSATEGFRYVLELGRRTFGDSVTMGERTIDFDEVEKWINAYEKCPHIAFDPQLYNYINSR